MALNTCIFQSLFHFNFPSFQMNSEMLKNPSIQQQVRYRLAEVQKQQFGADCALIADILCLIARDNSLQQETRVPDVGAIWFPLATGFSGMEGEAVCSAPPQPALSGVYLPQEPLVPQRISSLQRDLQLCTPLHCLYLRRESFQLPQTKIVMTEKTKQQVNEVRELSSQCSWP